MPFRSIPIPQFPMPQTQDLIVRIFVAHVCSKKRTKQQASHPAQEKDEQKQRRAKPKEKNEAAALAWQEMLRSLGLKARGRL